LFQRSGFVSSVVVLAAFPGVQRYAAFSEEFAPKTFDYEFKIEFGYSLDKFQYLQVYNANKPFITTSVGYRSKINNGFNEIRFNIVGGIPFDDERLILVKFQKINYILTNQFSSKNLFGLSMLNINQTDFSYADLTISFVQKFFKHYALELGFMQTIHNNFFKTNRKLINMNGFFVSLWSYF